MKRLVLPLLISLLLTACAGTAGSSSSTTDPAPAPVPEQSETTLLWESDAPENHGMDPEQFQLLHQALETSPVYGMLTVKDGVIIDEYYQDGYSADSVFPLHSCSKSFTGTLVGIAIQQGYIHSVDDLLSDYLPQVLEQEDAGKHQITLRHLLTHTSGLEWYEWNGASNWEEFRSAENWVDYILNRQLVHQPGSTFAYSTGGTHLLTAALEQATGQNALDYARENLFAPLGMDSVTWGTDPQGITDGGNGIAMTLRDAARFGELCLNNGEWEGEQLIPADWLADSTTAKNNGAGDGTGSYGYQWWIRSFNGYDCYYAFGAHGQYILIVPELELVTVIASNSVQNSYTPRTYFVDYVLAAVQGE